MRDTLFQGMLNGGAWGLLDWLTYGAVESILAYVVPMMWTPEAQFQPWQWSFVGLLFLTYALAGLASGALAGLIMALLGRTERLDYQAIALVPLVLAFALNLYPAWPLARSEQMALAIAFGLLVALTAGYFSKSWRRRTQFLTNPWAASLLLLGVPSVSRQALRLYSQEAKSVGSIVVVVAIMVVAYTMERFRAKRSGARKVAVLAIVLAVLATAAWVSSPGPAGPLPPAVASSEPNIILIVMDTVRADHLSAYGYNRDTTPALREFASHATLFTRAVAAADMTLPSHASIFTGLYPSWHGAYASPPQYSYGRPLGESTTLAKILREHGYHTEAVVANHSFLQVSMGLAQGFTVWDHHVPQHLAAESLPFFLREGARTILSLVMDTGGFDSYFLRAGDVSREAQKLLAVLDRHGPFLLFLNYMDAHTPYVPPQRFRDLFPGFDPRFRPAADHETLTNGINRGKLHVSAAQKQDLISQYDGGIAYLDSELGKLFQRLRDAGLYENALIIVTADHGEAFGERDLMQHGTGEVYQNQVHIPLFIKYPGQQQAKRSAALVSHVDLLPTILDVAGFPAPGNLMGRSLRLPDEAERAVFAEGRALGDQENNPRLRGVRRALFAGSMKLIQWSAGPPELYDLATDPDELHNIYNSDSAESTALTERILKWTATIPRQLPQSVKPDKETLDRIKSLGYVQ